MNQLQRRVHFHGSGGTLLGLVVVNLLLSVVTFGIYSFWGRTKMRQYIWGSTEFDGDPFEYHGTGGELLVGYLKAMGLMLTMAILLGVMTAIWQPDEAAAIVVGLAFWLAIMAFVPFAMISARRYRLSRTSWRNIRFTLRADVFDFVKTYLAGLGLTVVTLGLYAPFFQNRVREILTNSTYFGTEQFHYNGEGKDLFSKFLISLILTIPTLGLCWIWYKAERHRYYWAHTHFSDGQFSSSVSGGSLLGLSVTNFLLVVFTLGIGMPWALIRHFRYYTENTTFAGDIDYTRIEQDTEKASAIGEGLSDVFDGGGFDIGL